MGRRIAAGVPHVCQAGSRIRSQDDFRHMMFDRANVVIGVWRDVLG